MCKLFFSFHYPHTKKLLKDFFNQGNSENLQYGYGLAWKSDNSWKTYKCNCFHMTDPNSKKILADINSNIVVGHIRNIYHENMTPQQICDEIRIENTHPFEYKDVIFMHHGDFFLNYNSDLKNYQLGHNDAPFKKAMKKVRSHILPEFLKQIKGTTDSEILFYLLLSIQKTLVETEKLNTKEAIIASFNLLSSILDSVGMSNSSNIVFSTSDYAFVAKIYKNNSDMNLKNPDFFVSERNSALLFSNFNLVKDMKKVKKNLLYVIPIGDYKPETIDIVEL
jgi:predicted glutamine amidotransferase